MAQIYDALIIGAGPAGLVAALRLQQLGRSVLLAERSAVWPRPQIGEALTPGVRNIIELLDANDAMALVPHRVHRNSRLLWRNRHPENVAHPGSALVERAGFDAALLQLAHQRGINVVSPAQVQQVNGAAGDWTVALQTGGALPQVKQVSARFILDASGRGAGARSQIACAPRLAAVWAEFEQTNLPATMRELTQVEALTDGWLWGASLPDGRYRVMLLGDPRAARQAAPHQPEQRLRAACAASRLFGAIAQLPLSSPVQMCTATAYLATDSWQDGRLKLGDAAFALDPISSSGVEKAMRFSLQAAVAVHTLLGDQSPQRARLTRAFFEHRLIDTCARHAHWTAEYYGQSWCAGQPFWQARSSVAIPAGEHASDLMNQLQQTCAQLQQYREPVLRALSSLNPRRALRLNPQASVVEMPCIIDDTVQAYSALSHPQLERPLAFLDNEALFPHLHSLHQSPTLDSFLHDLGCNMPAHKAQRITAWLWQHGLLEHAG
ncbi:flavin-dependent monooxygenase QhpG [Janthinobacterium agaricidamnosum]|uniref:FAD binding domain protein n=1 Tax=Janthinobacterium agaricidamnosum NBRC 102515 = DSM 9628 TaxID=1349767 RepID=W0V8K1_9BURK|nr:tryptophan 7-halogenase [Janthinobacterium agaricidamnosum]CDG83592.1 FAD binding domain protein [Janthinobacterium agaricidamnosum NBRC 102515 = DSM 9628]